MCFRMDSFEVKVDLVEDEVAASHIDVTVDAVVPVERDAPTTVNFWEQELRGFSPIGMAAVVRAADVDKVTYWHRGRTPYLYGVLLFQPRVSQTIVDKVIAAIASVYPVHDGIKRIAVVAFEKNNGVHPNMRGVHAVGDFTDIVRFWSDLSTGQCAVQSLDVHRDAVCWTIMNPFHFYVPYIDIDELGTPSDFDRIWTTRVKVCINLVVRMLTEWQPEPVYQVYFNSRRSEKHPGLVKYSFHVHFYQTLVPNISSFKDALKKLVGMPPKREWTRTGPTSYTVKEDSRTCIFDSMVYGGRKQLFRGPFCGKNGQANTALLPISVTEEEGKVNVITHAEEDFDVRGEFIFRARIASPRCEGIMTLCPIKDADELDSGSIEPSFDPFAFSEPIQDDNAESKVVAPVTATYEFFKPIIYTDVLRAWQARRDQDSRRFNGTGWTIPVNPVTVIKDTAHPRNEHLRILKVRGDTYCETDDAHYHSLNPANVISIYVDLRKCLIWQHCFACGRAGPKYNFLHAGNRVAIKTADECQLTSESFFHPIQSPYTFMLDYYCDLFTYHPPTETLYVFDSDHMVWRTGASANGVIGRLFDGVNSKYVAYIQERQAVIFQEQVRQFTVQHRGTPEELEAKKEVLLKDGRKFINKHKSLCVVTVAARAKFIDDLRNFPVKNKVADMNAYPHVVPMRNLHAYDVFTGETCDFQSRHLFTGILDAELTSDTTELKAIEDWFLEIATGDSEKATYLKVISGYMMTFLMHDRKFYVLKGTGKNGKGIHKQFLVSILSGSRNTEARWKALNQNFWERKANSNSSAEAPSPEAHGMLNKTLFYTDDIERVTIDAGKVKRVVAGEVMSGRGLYSKPVVIEPKGKILWTTNHTIDLPGNDNAAWERFNQIDYNTKYVEKPEHVDMAHYKILQNDVAVHELLRKTDAFFTVCVRALTRYYRSLEFNSVTGTHTRTHTHTHTHTTHTHIQASPRR